MTFDRFLIVDWSAANTPRTGKDSIWIARAGKCGERVSNPSTRSAAMTEIEGEIAAALDAGARLFVGLDFAFGYPGDASALPGKGQWDKVWNWLSAHIEDDDANVSNRFAVGARLNERFDAPGPFWGHPPQHGGRYLGLESTKPDYAALGVREKRRIDALVPSAQPVWKLAYTGSVGSQALTGIARLQALRKGRVGERIAIWPFQTDFAANLDAPIVIAEIYPSLFAVPREAYPTVDEAQVRTLAQGFARLDREDRFLPFLDGPRSLGAETRADALTHEGWMVGFADERLAL